MIRSRTVLTDGAGGSVPGCGILTGGAERIDPRDDSSGLGALRSREREDLAGERREVAAEVMAAGDYLARHALSRLRGAPGRGSRIVLFL